MPPLQKRKITINVTHGSQSVGRRRGELDASVCNTQSLDSNEEVDHIQTTREIEQR